MHSIWQEQIEFPTYPILKRDKKTDLLYVGATLQHAIEAHFQKENGKAVMIIEEKSIADMEELGGMGILRAGNMNELKNLWMLRNYIVTYQIPCELEIISETSIQVHPIKLFLFMTKDIEIYEQTKISARNGKRLDIESAYIDAGQIIEDIKEKEKRYIHVFSRTDFLQLNQAEILEMRKYKDNYLVLSYQRELAGSQYYWEI